jgi:outer membrane protein TolC
MVEAPTAATAGLLALLACAAWATEPAPYRPPAEADSALGALVAEAFARNPGLRAGEAAREAARQRIAAAGALPDPVLTLGMQNDGFDRLRIGEMEGSYYQVMGSQALPWPGKRRAREELARLEAEAPFWEQERLRRGLRADVTRAWAALRLVHSQRELLRENGELLDQAIAAARARVETGQATALELMRAARQRSRLELDRLALDARERAARAALNRLRGVHDDAPLPEPTPLMVPLASALSLDSLMALVDEHSPELAAHDLSCRQAGRRLDLARRERLPDLALSAGVMPRGALDPMWQAGVSVALPMWAKRKQERGVAAAEQDLESSRQGNVSLNDQLWQVTRERLAALEAEQAAARLLRDRLLPQDEDLLRAALEQYAAGQGALAGVLATLADWLGDRAQFLESQARITALLAAIEEINPTGTPPVLSGPLGAAAVAMEPGPAATESSGRPQPISGAGPGKASAGPAMNNM